MDTNNTQYMKLNVHQKMRKTFQCYISEKVRNMIHKVCVTQDS